MKKTTKNHFKILQIIKIKMILRKNNKSYKYKN